MKTLSQRLADTHAQAVADSKGPTVVAPDGTLVPAPTTAQLRDDFLAQRAVLIGQNSLPTSTWPMSNNALFRRVSTLASNLTVAQQQLEALQQAVPTMIEEAVTSAINALVGGMLPESLDTLKELVDHAQADETGLANLLAQQSADRTRFALLESPVAALPDQLAAKANATTVQGLSQRVGVAESTLINKADSATVVTLQAAVGTKAEASTVTTLQTTVAGKADSSLVSTLRTDLTALSGKLDTTTTTATNTAASVASLTPTVNSNSTDIGTLKTTASSLRTDNPSRAG
jgi:regulator of replication initiation timing